MKQLKSPKQNRTEFVCNIYYQFTLSITLIVQLDSQVDLQVDSI